MTAPTLVPPKTRAQAVRSFDVADFPALTGREEEWRFTPLKRLRGLESATSAGGLAPKVEVGELPDGVAVSTIDRSDPRVGSVLVPFDRISAIAYRGATEALLVAVDRAAVLSAPAFVRLVGAGTELAFGTRSSRSATWPRRPSCSSRSARRRWPTTSRSRSATGRG
jgi:Fe-S cluster assembly protein SufD